MKEKRLLDDMIVSLLSIERVEMEMKEFLSTVDKLFVKCKSYYSPKNIKSILRHREK